MSTHDGGVDGRGWHTVRRSSIDTAIVPDWLRTGYRYFPFAALLDGHWWTLRANFCFPEHDFFTLFIDGVVVAEVTAEADDARPLVASIGRLSPTHPQLRNAHLPVMSAVLAKRVVEVVAPFINHGSEWGDPCDLCEFADRNPFEPADDDTATDRLRGDGEAHHHG